jgi:hypothetical protein
MEDVDVRAVLLPQLLSAIEADGSARQQSGSKAGPAIA